MKYSWEYEKIKNKGKRENRYLKYNPSKGWFLGKHKVSVTVRRSD